MLKLLKFAHQFYGRIESQRSDLSAAEPEKTQRRFLLDLLRKNAASHFGKIHGFDKIRNENDFRRQIPVRDYEDFRPFINRIIAGERSVLTTEDSLMMTLTSGTTSEPKYVPVTRVSQALNSSLMRQWLYRAESDHKGLTAQASVGIVSRAIEGVTASGVPFGSASGVIYKNIPWFIRRAYAIPYLVSEIEDYDERYFVLARFALAARVSFIATPNPSTLLRLAQISSDHQEDLIRAVHDGTLGAALNKQTDIHGTLAAMLKPDRERAQRLSQIVAEKGFLRLADCWPDLRLVGCWLGGSVGAQAGQLAEIFGRVPLRDLGFMASEGHLTLPFKDETSAGILALQNNFYEFIPEEEADEAEPICLSSHQLEAGRRYSILLSNAAGLYRYRLNDIVEVTGYYGQTPLISFIRKAGEMTSLTGEKMHANHFLEAIDAVRGRFNLEIEQFRAAPNFNLSRYEIYLELRQRSFSDKILQEIDESLQRVNLEYRQKRQSSRLTSPCLHLMKRGWADDCLRRHIAQGKRDTQYKPPILCPEPMAADAPFISRTIEIKTRQFSTAGIYR